MLLNFLLICALVGAVWAFIGQLWDKSEPFLAKLVSFFVPGLFTGLLLFGFMGAGYLFGWWDSIRICNFHPFWVGVVLMTVREVALTLYYKFR